MAIESLIGKKLGMTQIFRPDGTVVPVTVIEAGPNWVTQIRTEAKEGYNAVQLGYGAAKRLTRPERGHLAKAGTQVPPVRSLREFRVDDVAGVELGQRVDASVFTAGETVDVISISKGKGFAGVVKRHHFAGGPKTHGQSDRHRAPGSIGATTTPGRIVKGLRMAGRLGGGRVTVQNIEVVQADPERNIVMLRGAVPGHKGALVMIRRSLKSRR